MMQLSVDSKNIFCFVGSAEMIKVVAEDNKHTLLMKLTNRTVNIAYERILKINILVLMSYVQLH